MPGSKRSVVAEAKDLKPFIVRDLRCTFAFLVRRGRTRIVGPRTAGRTRRRCRSGCLRPGSAVCVPAGSRCARRAPDRRLDGSPPAVGGLVDPQGNPGAGSATTRRAPTSVSDHPGPLTFRLVEPARAGRRAPPARGSGLGSPAYYAPDPRRPEFDTRRLHCPNTNRPRRHWNVSARTDIVRFSCARRGVGSPTPGGQVSAGSASRSRSSASATAAASRSFSARNRASSAPAPGPGHVVE